MSDDGSNHDRQESGHRLPVRPESVWVERYAAKHRWQRLTDFPVGLQAPVKVRIYRRSNHFILQWWDPGAKRNLAERIDGDLLSALIAARKIDERLANQHTAGTGRRRLDHAELVNRYVEDLHKRADAGSLSPASTRRFISALRHYLEFIADPMVARNYPYAANINRDFRLTFGAYLTNRQIGPTPLIQGRRLYVHFGHQGTACLDLSGKVLWRNTGLSYAPVHGNGCDRLQAVVRFRCASLYIQGF